MRKGGEGLRESYKGTVLYPEEIRWLMQFLFDKILRLQWPRLEYQLKVCQNAL